MALVTKKKLINLPQHILSQVVTHTVVDASPEEALKLRLINKKFNHEVSHVVFEKGWVDFQSRNIPNDVTIFRYFRGFLLRRECEERLLPLRQRLLEAAVVLTDFAKSIAPADEFSGDFSDLYESKPEQCPSEEAIAALAASALVYVGGPKAVCRIWASARRHRSTDATSDDDASSRHSDESDELSDVDSMSEADEIPTSVHDDDNSEDGSREPIQVSGPWTMLAAKDVNFWVLLTVSFFGKLDLVQRSLISMRDSPGPNHSLTLELQSVFQLAVHQGHQSVVKFLLEQQELAPGNLPQSFVLNNQNALETAIKAENVSMVKTLLASGWDLASIATEYNSALLYSIRYTKDAAIREELVRIFLQVTQEWRSSSITCGIFREICAKGDTKLAEVVLQLVKDNTADLFHMWEWTLPERFDDWLYHDDCAMVTACDANSTELVRFLFANREHLPRSMSKSFRTYTIRRCLETAISRNNKQLLAELLKHKNTISSSKLLAYGTLKGDLDTLKMLAEGLDLQAKIKRDRYFQGYDSGSQLSYELNDKHARKTPFLHEKGLVTLGSFCLIIAIKCLRVETAKYFIDRGVRIGTRLTFLSRNFVCNSAALIAEDTSSLGSRAVVLTHKQIYLLDCKNLLGRGARCFDGGLVFIKNEKGWGWKVRTTRILKDIDARAISCIHVPTDLYDSEKWNEMDELVKKHKLPQPYLDDD